MEFTKITNLKLVIIHFPNPELEEVKILHEKTKEIINDQIENDQIENDHSSIIENFEIEHMEDDQDSINDQNTVHEDNIVYEDHKDYKCESCGQIFSQAEDLKNHILIVHEDHKRIIIVNLVVNHFLKQVI